ncbi:MAG: hypothetical protein MZU84_01775 [Sphingobacterium sp.]|nr:hypothetical protein [Sphingobacterium sp.]
MSRILRAGARQRRAHRDRDDRGGRPARRVPLAPGTDRARPSPFSTGDLETQGNSSSAWTSCPDGGSSDGRAARGVRHRPIRRGRRPCRPSWSCSTARGYTLPASRRRVAANPCRASTGASEVCYSQMLFWDSPWRRRGQCKLVREPDGLAPDG